MTKSEQISLKILSWMPLGLGLLYYVAYPTICEAICEALLIFTAVVFFWCLKATIALGITFMFYKAIKNLFTQGYLDL
jgi:hypothetical protein